MPASVPRIDDTAGTPGNRIAELVVEVADLAAKLQLLKADLRLGEGLPGRLPDQSWVVAQVKAKIAEAENRLEAAKDTLGKAFDNLPRG
jgi:hypothetical protein